MKTISNGFKEALTNIKQIDTIITYADRDNTNYIITQNSEFLQTEAEDFLVTESAEVVVDNGGIQNVSIYWNTDIFKSVCKMLNLETSNQIVKGTELNVRIGLLVGENYEYVDYGKFYTTEDSAYQLATGTYTTTAYDKMIKFNIKAIDNPLTFVEDTTYTLKQYLEMICNKCGVQYSFNWTNLPNGSKQVISGDPYAENKEVTYRDILDDIAESLGTNFIINADNKIANKEIAMTSVMTIDDDILKDENVYIGEKKDPIDGLQVYDGSTMLNYAGNDDSVLKIKSNNIMSAHSQDLMASVLSLITDFTYYAYQLETFGVFAIEPFDCFTVAYNNTNYLLCSFHNDLQITSGVSEEISYDFSDEDSTYNYAVSNSEDKSRDAFIEIDKAKGQVVLKADSDGKIVEARLDANASDGSAFNVKADNINLEGYTTINNGFKIDLNGSMEATSGKIAGFDISDKFTSNSSITRNYTQSDLERLRQIMLGNITPTSNDYEYFDINGTRHFDTTDLLRVSKIVNGSLSPIQSCIYTIDPNNSVHCINIINTNTNERNVSLGLFGGYIRELGVADLEIDNGHCYGNINIDGNLGVEGDLFVMGSKDRLVKINENEGVLLNAYETATPYFGDIGSNKTNEDGYCKIPIDKLFAKTIEIDDYKVFIQECGEGHLYVKKHKNYFEVFGTANLDFDWELKAVQKDYKNVRLQKKEMKPLKGDDN